MGREPTFFSTEEFMKTDEILQKVEVVVSPILQSLGFRLIEREIVNEAGWILRLYIDHRTPQETQVTINDCVDVTRALSDALDVEEIMAQRYSLEVSSPGIGRPLRYAEDFERFKGAQVRLKAKEKINGRENFKGILEGIQNNDVIVKIDDQCYQIPLSLLAKARIEPELNFGKQAKRKN